ncbi:MAG: hypothetical protein ACQEXX_30980 [Bacillota bacterium]
MDRSLRRKKLCLLKKSRKIFTPRKRNATIMAEATELMVTVAASFAEAPVAYAVGPFGPFGPIGPVGPIGPAGPGVLGIPGGRAIIPFASGAPLALTTVARGLVGSVGLAGFG